MSKNYNQSGIGTLVELGKRGPQLKNNSDVIEHRNQADSAFVVARAADPVGPNDLVTKQYMETRANVIVTGQIDGGSPPAAGPVGTIYVCTTTGGAYTEKYLYRSDGSTWVEIVPIEGMVMSITDALTGGNITFQADHLYMWDADGTDWINLGPSAAESGLVKSARLAVAYTDGDDPVQATLIKNLPAGCVVTKVLVNVTQAWGSPLPIMTIGDTSDPDRLAQDKDIDLNKVGLYTLDNAHLYGSATDVNVYIDDNGATPAAGAALIIVQYDLA